MSSERYFLRGWCKVATTGRAKSNLGSHPPVQLKCAAQLFYTVIEELSSKL